MDFIKGPYCPPNHRPGFLVKIDHQHAGINPYFVEVGTYKFVAQAIAIHTEKPEYLTVFVDWDGKKLTVRSDSPSQVLAMGGILEV